MTRTRQVDHNKMNEEKLEKKLKKKICMQSQDEQLQARKQNEETSGTKSERAQKRKRHFLQRDARSHRLIPAATPFDGGLFSV